GRPASVHQKIVDIPRDEPGPHDPERMSTQGVTGQPVGGQRGRGGRPCRRDDRALEDGEWVTRLVAIEDEHGRGPWESVMNIGGKARDPFYAGHPEAVTKVGGERDNPTARLVGELQEVAIRVDRLSRRVRQIRLLDDLRALLAMGADEVEDGFPLDDRHVELHPALLGWLLQSARPRGIEDGVE